MTPDTDHLMGPDGRLEPTWAFLVFHDALRRDAARFTSAARVTAAAPYLDSAVAASDGLAQHWRHYRALLEFHHITEDTALFSTVRQAAPELRAILDELAADHLTLDAHLHRLDRLVSACGTADHEPDVLTAAFAELESELGPHLAVEEHDLVPVIRRIIDEAATADPAAGAPPPPATGPVPADFAPTRGTSNSSTERPSSSPWALSAPTMPPTTSTDCRFTGPASPAGAHEWCADDATAAATMDRGGANSYWDSVATTGSRSLQHDRS